MRDNHAPKHSSIMGTSRTQNYRETPNPINSAVPSKETKGDPEKKAMIIT